MGQGAVHSRLPWTMAQAHQCPHVKSRVTADLGGALVGPDAYYMITNNWIGQKRRTHQRSPQRLPRRQMRTSSVQSVLLRYLGCPELSCSASEMNHRRSHSLSHTSSRLELRPGKYRIQSGSFVFAAAIGESSVWGKRRCLVPMTSTVACLVDFNVSK